MIDTWIKFIKAHENLAVVIIVVVFMWYGYGRWLDYQDKHATAQEKISQAAALQQQQIVSQMTQSYNQLLAQVTAQNTAMNNLISAREEDLKKHQSIDQTAPLPDVARRVADLAGFDQAWVTPAPGGVLFTEQATRKTAQTLEQVPVLQKNLDDTTTMLKGEQAANKQCNDLVAAQKDEITKNNKAAQDEIAKVKADAAKAKRKWFTVGAVTGLLLRGAGSIFAGI